MASQIKIKIEIKPKWYFEFVFYIAQVGVFYELIYAENACDYLARNCFKYKVVK